MKKKFFSLNFKQVMIIVAPLAIVALFTIIAFSQIINLMLETIIIDKINSTTQTIAEETSYSMDLSKNSLDMLSESIGTDTSINNIDRLLKTFAKHYPQCTSYYYGTITPKIEVET